MPGPTQDLADEWRRLLAEWELAMATYRTAGGAGADGPDTSLPTANPEMEAAARRLAELKRQMDIVVAAGKATRRTRDQREELIARTIDLPDRDAGVSPDETDAGPGADT